MRRRIAIFFIISLSLAVLLSSGIPAGAADTEDIKTSEISKGTPVIDGIMDDVWNTTPALRVDRTPIVLDTEHFEPGTDFNPRNVTGTVRVLWDEDNLYIYAEINDPKVKDADDRFNVFVSPRNHRTKYTGKIPGQHDPNAPEAYQSEDIFIKFERNKIFPTGPDTADYIPDGCYAEIKSGIKQKIKDNGVDGWVVEGCIPWAPTFTPTEGMTIGFDCQIDDQDPPSNFAGFIVWNDPNDEVWQDPSMAGQLILKNVASMEGDGNNGETSDNDSGENNNSGNSQSSGGNGDVNEGNSSSGGNNNTGNGNTSVSTDSSDSTSTQSGDGEILSSGTQSGGQETSDKEVGADQSQSDSKTAKIVIFCVIIVLCLAGIGLSAFFIFKNKKGTE